MDSELLKAIDSHRKEFVELKKESLKRYVL